MSFERTISGKKAKHQFYDQSVVWVEGATDRPAIAQLLDGLDHHIEVAGGREECHKLAKHMADNDLPYVVVIDGDYEVLDRSRSFHRRAVYLFQYSIENYLFDLGILSTVCWVLACSSGNMSYQNADIHKEVQNRFEKVISELNKVYILLVYDIASVKKDRESTELPNDIRKLFDCESLEIDADKMIENINISNYTAEEIDYFKNKVDKYLSESDIKSLIRGHSLMVLCRCIVKSVTRELTGQENVMDNQGMYGIMGANIDQSVDERVSKLRRRLRSSVREANRMLKK